MNWRTCLRVYRSIIREYLDGGIELDSAARIVNTVVQELRTPYFARSRAQVRGLELIDSLFFALEDVALDERRPAEIAAIRAKLASIGTEIEALLAE